MNTATTLAALTFATITDVEATVSETLARVHFTFAGRRYEATSFRGGRLEVYEVDPSDGIAMWLGYYEDVAPYLPGMAAKAFTEAHAALEAVSGGFWGEYLPGARAWLAA
jgi:hypothetical protein